VRKYFPQKGNFEDTALQRMAQNNVLHSTELDGDWITINNLKQLEVARQKLIEQ
jgi:NDP-sugar pyrophosphorylase family protein